MIPLKIIVHSNVLYMKDEVEEIYLPFTAITGIVVKEKELIIYSTVEDMEIKITDTSQRIITLKNRLLSALNIGEPV